MAGGTYALCGTREHLCLGVLGVTPVPGITKTNTATKLLLRSKLVPGSFLPLRESAD